MGKIDILSLTQEELAEQLIGEKKYRAGQVFSWLHEKKAASFDEMTNLPKDLRLRLHDDFTITAPEILDVKISLKDKTQKYLLDLLNNTIIESVLMDYEYGRTVCVSSQAGCKMGCSFCASQIGDFHRSLTAGEMLSQVYAIERHCGERIGRVVIMGSGEPFDNFEATVKFIRLLNDKNGHNMGMRNITVSTCGIVPKIYEFAKMDIQANLAVSLHAPNDAVRSRIMPIAKKYPFNELLEACKIYMETTGRRVTFEYALIDGVNDSAESARELARSLKGLLCHVNIIPANQVKELGIKASTKTEQFSRLLSKAGITVTVRRKLGDDIDSACGQLRNRYLNNELNSDDDCD